MRLRGFLAALAAVLLLFAPASAHTREEVRAQYAKISDWSAGNLYLSEPSVSAPYAAGEVRPEALSDALDYLNFLRWLAGLEEVELDSALTGIAQYGAVLTAANGFVSHEPPAPADMDAAFYDKALYAAGTCNIVSLNWTSEDVLRQGLAYFARDDGEQNLSTLGHRRWLFNPVMGYTGFGLAGDANGASYITMYAHDLQGEPGAWEYVAWPSAGAFPAELMSAELAWSIVLNPEIYDTDGAWARLTNLETGAVYNFPGDGGYFAVDSGGYGAGPCLIFRPEVEEGLRAEPALAGRGRNRRGRGDFLCRGNDLPLSGGTRLRGDFPAPDADAGWRNAGAYSGGGAGLGGRFERCLVEQR